MQVIYFTVAVTLFESYLEVRQLKQLSKRSIPEALKVRARLVCRGDSRKGRSASIQIRVPISVETSRQPAVKSRLRPRRGFLVAQGVVQEKGFVATRSYNLHKWNFQMVRLLTHGGAMHATPAPPDDARLSALLGGGEWQVNRVWDVVECVIMLHYGASAHSNADSSQDGNGRTRKPPCKPNSSPPMTEPSTGGLKPYQE